MMPDDQADVLLVSDDAAFCAAAEKHRPAALTLRRHNPSDDPESAPGTARQVWVDLDTTESPPGVDAPRRVYFYSQGKGSPRGLPPGLFIRKPCTPVVFQVLWAEAERNPARHTASSTDRSAAPSLPAWILDLHELKLATLCHKLVAALPVRLGYAQVSLYLHDPVRRVLTLAETNHTRPIEAIIPTDATGQNLMAAVARTRHVFQTEYADDEISARGIQRDDERTYDDGACLIAPLVADGQLGGVINLSGRKQTSLTETDPPLAEIFAFVARSLQIARAYDAARTEARVDGLTGLFNARWMRESLEKEIRRAERYGTPLSVLMIDLDGLKAINDEQGHVAGDAVLRHAASRITRILRQFDGAARIGGDEFVIMLPGTNAGGAQHVARRLRVALVRDTARYRNLDLPIAASIGAAEWQRGWDVERLLESADQAMYHDKKTARGKSPARAAPTATDPTAVAPSNFRTGPKKHVSG